jgi:hypothetical protein
MGRQLTNIALLFAAGVLVVACTHGTPVVSQVQLDHPVRIIEHGTPPPAGMRMAIQFDNEPPIFRVSDGQGGPPILYHGHELNPDQVKSVVILRGKEARERFHDQKLDAAILVGLK